jgi:phospholipase C
VPFTQLSADVRNNRLPAFSFITPDTCHDGHDPICSNGAPGGLTSADAFLAKHVPVLLAYLRTHNGLLIINFDESDTGGTSPVCSTCVSGGIGGQVGALFLSPRLPQGAVVTTSYDHYNLLRTIEDAYGISEHLNLAARATPMTAVFGGYR